MSTERVFSRKVATAASELVVIVLLGMTEVMTRLARAYKFELSVLLNTIGIPAVDLDEYEMVDLKHPGNWVPKPGYKKTMAEVIDEKRRAGKSLAVDW